MRTAIRWTIRAALLALLVLAVVDPPLPGDGPRRRVYVIDASDSVRLATGSESFTTDDALRIATHDLASLRADDVVALVVAAARAAVLVPPTPVSKVRFPARIEGVDGSSTDLAGALELARSLAESGDIVLCSDGRPTGARIAVEKIRVPVHVYALGPLGGVDAAIRAIDAPATAPPGASVSLRLSIESTGPWKGTVENLPVEFTGPGLQDLVLNRTMPRDGALDMRVSLGGLPDLCPGNDTVVVTVWSESRLPKVLIVRGGIASAFPPSEWSVTESGSLASADEADVVILQDLRADAVSRAELDRLAKLVRDEGVGLVMLGGSSAYALGGWQGTPVEDLLPFWAFPDERSAVVVVLDRSGSMNEPAPGRTRPRIEEAANAASRALRSMHDDDEVGVVTFAEAAEIRCPLVRGAERGRAAAALTGISAGGSTVLSEAVTLAASVVKSSKAGRRHLLVVTDGRSVDEENAIRAAARATREDGIGVLVVRIGDATTPALAILREAGAREVDGSNFATLDATIGEALARSRELAFSPPGEVMFAGLRLRPELANRVSLKPGSQVLGRAGDVPVVALRGRVAASALFTWPDSAPFLQRLVSAVTPPGGRTSADVSLRFDEGLLRITAAMRGAGRPDKLDLLVDGSPVALPRSGENRYEGSVRNVAGNAAVRMDGRIVAVARRPHPPEFERVGPDVGALEKIAAATGGSRFGSPKELSQLPRRGSSAPKSGRVLFLAVGLVLFLLDVAVALLPRRLQVPSGGVR